MQERRLADREPTRLDDAIERMTVERDAAEEALGRAEKERKKAKVGHLW